MIRYHIEGIKYWHGQLMIKGWAIGEEGQEVSIRLTEKGRDLDISLVRRERPDLAGLYQAEGGAGITWGFCITAFPEESEILGLFLCGLTQQIVVKIHLERLLNGLPTEQCWEEQGMSGFGRKIKKTVKRVLLSEKEQDGETLLSVTGVLSQGKRERLKELKRKADMLSGPLFSIVVPVYRPERRHLEEMLESVLGQVYENWELCIAEASMDGGSTLAVIRPYEEKDSRIRIKTVSNQGISGNTNVAFAMAKGEFVVMLDHDDLLEPDALYQAAKWLERQPDLDFIYTDSDLTDEYGMEFHSPLYKEDWSEETMYSANYINHLSIIRRSVLEQAGGWRTELDGAQDWDLFFRVSETACKIASIPKVLYHWRTAASSTANSMDTKPYARKAQLLAVQGHLERTGRKGQVIFDEDTGSFRVRWKETPSYRILHYGERIEAKEGQDLDQVLIFHPPGILISAQAAGELAAFAAQPDVAFVVPKLLFKDGTIKSIGIGEHYKGKAPHVSDCYGSADWYRNPKKVEPDCVAVSIKHLMLFWSDGKPVLPENMREYSERAGEKGFRNVMTPFAEAVTEE